MWLTILHLSIAVLPGRAKRFLYRNLFKYEIGKDVFIGLSIIDCRSVRIGQGAFIGNFNKISQIQRFEMGEMARIGSFNSISGPRHTADESPCFLLGAHSSITRGHRIDCSAPVLVGSFTTIAGAATLIFTHGIDVNEGMQSAQSVQIGNYCLIGANCTILSGSALPDFSVLGAGSVLNRNFDESYTLYAGSPASRRKSISNDARYFNRTVGRVEWPDYIE